MTSECASCGKGGDVPLKTCGRCGTAAYCSAECQRTHWKAGGDGSHKVACDAAIAEAMAALKAAKNGQNDSSENTSGPAQEGGRKEKEEEQQDVGGSAEEPKEDTAAQAAAKLIAKFAPEIPAIRCEGCHILIEDASGKSRCGACRLVFYCSRECQTAHWNAPTAAAGSSDNAQRDRGDASHKIGCKLRQLYPVALRLFRDWRGRSLTVQREIGAGEDLLVENALVGVHCIQTKDEAHAAAVSKELGLPLAQSGLLVALESGCEHFGSNPCASIALAIESLPTGTRFQTFLQRRQFEPATAPTSAQASANGSSAHDYDAAALSFMNEAIAIDELTRVYAALDLDTAPPKFVQLLKKMQGDVLVQFLTAGSGRSKLISSLLDGGGVASSMLNARMTNNFEPMIRVFHKNAYSLRSPLSRRIFAHAFYETASYVNHACIPNARFVPESGVEGGRLRIVSTTHIPAGDPVTISYTHFARAGFPCSCGTCGVLEALWDQLKVASVHPKFSSAQRQFLARDDALGGAVSKYGLVEGLGGGGDAFFWADLLATTGLAHALELLPFVAAHFTAYAIDSLLHESKPEVWAPAFVRLAPNFYFLARIWRSDSLFTSLSPAATAVKIVPEALAAQLNERLLLLSIAAKAWIGPIEPAWLRPFFGQSLVKQEIVPLAAAASAERVREATLPRFAVDADDAADATASLETTLRIAVVEYQATAGSGSSLCAALRLEYLRGTVPRALFDGIHEVARAGFGVPCQCLKAATKKVATDVTA